MRPVVELEHLSCKMGQSYLLKDITWEVMPGENWVVYGLNGSGKTTLLSIIAGYKNYTTGKLKVFGEKYDENNVLALRRRIGWVSGSFYDKHYTKESVLDIILSGKFGTLSLNYGVNLDDVVLAQKIARELGIGELLSHSFDMLSKGQRQNVMIARALMSNPELLILDEPCSGLDVYNREHLFQSIRQLSEIEGMAIIYVTHYTEEIIEVFDQALLLRAGRIFDKGRVDELFQSKSLQEFLGYPVGVERGANGKIYLEVEAKSNISEIVKGGKTC